MIIRYALALALFAPFQCFAQITVDSDLDPETLVEEFLLGSGVLITNVEFVGIDTQIGAYFDGDSSVSMSSGLVMSTAAVTNLDGSSVNEVGGGISGDDDLLEVANLVPPLIGQMFSVVAVNDVASIEFDFIPYGDSLNFRYVFCSDEYLEWVNTQFNDVFAFFISGPGLEGPYSSPPEFPNGAVNIASVPGSDPPLPITVSSVNNMINSEYYIDNPWNELIVIDGYTVVLNAVATGLEVGETYHMRLAIADGSDSILESAVLFETGSFSCFESVDPGSLGDLNDDGILNVDDLLLLITEFGCTVDCNYDLDGDGQVNVWDIVFFLGLFGG